MAEATKPAVKPAEKSDKKIDPILKQLLEAGAHFGHQASRWNPKMESYIYTSRGGVHIIDLTQTAEALKKAEDFVYTTAKTGGQILFVGTKRQAQAVVIAAAKDAGMPYVSHRWLGGMLTNLDTINSRILRLKKLESKKAEDNFAGSTKKEKGIFDEEIRKLSKTFDGVREMYGVPAAIFVVDMPKEDIAIAEARKLGIPVVAIADTNADVTQADYPIPANDDAIRAVTLITGRIASAAKKGMGEYQAKTVSENDQAQSEAIAPSAAKPAAEPVVKSETSPEKKESEK